MEPNNSVVEVIGVGCHNCHVLYEQTQQAVKELGLPLRVDYSTDIQKIISLGLLSSPVLTLNGKPIVVGLPSNIEKIKKAILEHWNV